jgi:hypothetical protein
MDGTGGYHVKWNKPDSKRQILNVFTHTGESEVLASLLIPCNSYIAGGKTKWYNHSKNTNAHLPHWPTNCTPGNLPQRRTSIATLKPAYNC